MAIRSPKWLVLATLVAIAPDTPGVFELWDDDEVVYVGATRTLRRELVGRLLDHASDATHSAGKSPTTPSRASAS
jgi:excinuclease UvrABC nuclease subunit